MSDTLINAYQFNLAYARQLVDDVAEDQMAAQPVAGMNHPAWVLGHLTVVSHAGLGMLGVDQPPPEGWKSMFGPRTTPSADASVYPDKQTLLDAYEHVHERVVAAYPQADSAKLDAPSTHPLKDVLPTHRAVLTHMMTTHEATHLGQLSAWRRVMGLASVRG